MNPYQKEFVAQVYAEHGIEADGIPKPTVTKPTKAVLELCCRLLGKINLETGQPVVLETDVRDVLDEVYGEGAYAHVLDYQATATERLLAEATKEAKAAEKAEREALAAAWKEALPLFQHAAEEFLLTAVSEGLDPSRFEVEVSLGENGQFVATVRPIKTTAKQAA